MDDHNLMIGMHEILSAQRSIIEKSDAVISKLEIDFANVSGHAYALNELADLMSEIERDVDVLSFSDLEEWQYDETKILSLYEQKKLIYTDQLKTLQYTSWDQFVRDSQFFCLTNGLESALPWEAMLTEDAISQIKSECYQSKYKWDQLDYIVVGAAGILAFLTDVFLVAIPKTLNSGVYKGQEGSIITEKLRSIQLPPNIQEGLEKLAKVPYDSTGGGDHRIDTFGHDPVLGFIVGTIDLMRGGASTIKGGNIAFESSLADPIKNPLYAVTIQFLHMLSDVATSKGLPVPFSSVLRALKLGSFEGPTGKSRTISQLILWMYHNGYDLRHFVTMGITPATIEIVLRSYLMISHYSTNGETKFILADNPKYRSMLLSAHAIACAGNAGKIALMQGNPLAINYPEWLALLRYLLPSIKYWVFDRQRLQLDHLESINEQGWAELCQSSEYLLRRVYSDTAPVVVLGAER